MKENPFARTLRVTWMNSSAAGRIPPGETLYFVHSRTGHLSIVSNRILERRQ